jgi:MFS family permease
MANSTTAAYIPEQDAASSTGRGSYAALFTICFVSSMFGGVVSTLMSVYLPVAVKDLLGPVTDAKLNAVSASINSVFIFGWMFGGVVWGLVCDRIGRARSVMLSTLCYGLFTVLTSISPSWEMVVVCRLLSGFGVGGVLVTTTIIISEAWTGKRRAVALGILSISIPVGIFSAGLINYLLPTWRQAFLTGIIPLLAAVAALFLLKESGKWKTAEKTRRGFLAADYRKNLWTGSLIFGTMLIGMWAIFSWLPTWVQSLPGSSDAQHQGGISMMMMGAGGLTGGFISGWVAHAIGLRKTMLLCFSICLHGCPSIQAYSCFFGSDLCRDRGTGRLFRYQPGGVVGLYPGIVSDGYFRRSDGVLFQCGQIVHGHCCLLCRRAGQPAGRL